MDNETPPRIAASPAPETESHAAPSDTRTGDTVSPTVTTRAILLGLLLIPINCYWMAIIEIRWNSLDTTCVSLFFHVISFLFALTLANALLLRWVPRWALTRAELLTLYVMLSIASAVMGRDSMENLPPLLGHLFWFADPGNRYSRFFNSAPRWWTVKDLRALEGYYAGNSSLAIERHWMAWLGPMAFWIGFFIVLTVVMLCLNVLVRRQWTENERLTFPLVQLPLAVSNTETYRSRLLWLGFALPVIVQSFNNLNYLYPSVPGLHLKLRDYGPYITSPPWNGVGWLPVGFFPFAIGFTYFLPLNLSFSCWFFYLLRKMVDVLCVAWGLRGAGASPASARFPYVMEQGIGAWVGLSLALVWISRHYILTVLRAAIRGGPEATDEGAGLSYRTALLGIVAGMTVLVAACSIAGMTPWLPVVYFAFYFVLSLGITRVRAELGPPAHELNWVNPEKLMVMAFGTEALGTRNLTLLTYMFWFNRGYRSHPMPHQLEGMRIARVARMESRRLAAAMILAAIVGAVAGAWALLDVFYRYGEATAHIMSYSTGIGREAFNRLRDWQDNPRPPDAAGLSFAGLGAAVTLLLGLARTRFFWWPFHPIGYALANSYALEYFWSAMLVGWAIKLLVLRYGGGRLYRDGIPFFTGVILGDYVIASAWSLIGCVGGFSTYRTFIF